MLDVEVLRQGGVVVLDEVLGKYRRYRTIVTGSDALNAIAVGDNLTAIALVESRSPELSNLVRKIETDRRDEQM